MKMFENSGNMKPDITPHIKQKKHRQITMI